MKSVGSYEAKTHLPRLLSEVEHGETITITKRGKPIAVLSPAVAAPKPDVHSTIEQIKEFRKGRTLGGLTIREMIEEGRRF
ncbi:MAG: type II toxin-antitoxin system Phd/YefM family antitoxin [Isosphaeraceae bacterium]